MNENNEFQDLEEMLQPESDNPLSNDSIEEPLDSSFNKSSNGESTKSDNPKDSETGNHAKDPSKSNKKSFQFKVNPSTKKILLLTGGAICFGAASIGLIKTIGFNSIESFTSSSPNNGYTKTQLNEILNEFKENINNATNEKLDVLYKDRAEVLKNVEKLVDKKVAIASKNISDKLNSQTKTAVLSTEMVENIATQIIDKKFQHYNDNFDLKLINTTTKLNSKINELDNKVTSIVHSNNIFAQTKPAVRTRMHGFNILSKVVDDVYSLRAPDKKNGKKNYITLQKGEVFHDIHGKHKVLNIVIKDGKPRYLVDESLFIDGVREAYNDAEIRLKKGNEFHKKNTSIHEIKENNIKDKNKSVEQEKKVMTKPKSPALVSLRQENSHFKDGKILLPKWQVVMQSPDLKSALVVDSSLNPAKPIELELNKYQSFFGTVTHIGADGTVCSDRYCIGHLE